MAKTPKKKRARPPHLLVSKSNPPGCLRECIDHFRAQAIAASDRLPAPYQSGQSKTAEEFDYWSNIDWQLREAVELCDLMIEVCEAENPVDMLRSIDAREAVAGAAVKYIGEEANHILNAAATGVPPLSEREFFFALGFDIEHCAWDRRDTNGVLSVG